jgi:hypothetical protein
VARGKTRWYGIGVVASDNISQEIGRRIREHREAQWPAQTQDAYASRFSLTLRQYQRIEAGESLPPWSLSKKQRAQYGKRRWSLQELLDELGVEYRDLFHIGARESDVPISQLDRIEAMLAEILDRLRKGEVRILGPQEAEVDFSGK